MYNFAPAAEDERIVFGACRPNHPRRAPPDSSVDDWVRYMQERDVERVCCLLDETQLSEYDDPLDIYVAAFGEDRVRHAPIEDFSVVDRQTLHETILPFLDASTAASERVVVHCSAGSGRTGHVLALWLAHDRGCSVEDAVAEVRRMGRRPLEAASRADLRALL
ncbi:protein-tyrosine phosphatase family protein [Haloplanus natans]|uniref:protein-tyrosine phosphatase family protein n=1 Tax=Haloplanus natans TaxID=376171 RepID=UPI000677CBDE